MSSAVFEHTMDGVLITNAENKIIHVNDSFVEITGYTDREVIGKDPKLLKSGIHNKHFGQWQGEITNRKKNGEIYIEWLSVNTIRNDQGGIEHFIGIFSDVTHQRKDAQHNAYLATHDPLTGLSNRLLLNDRLEHAINHAYRFNKCIADEFVILIEELRSFDYLEKILEKIRAISEQTFHIDGLDLSIGMSIGASVYPNDSDTPEGLLKCADEAMYRAKSGGKNMIAFYQTNPQIYCANTYVI